METVLDHVAGCSSWKLEICVGNPACRGAFVILLAVPFIWIGLTSDREKRCLNMRCLKEKTWGLVISFLGPLAVECGRSGPKLPGTLVRDQQDLPCFELLTPYWSGTQQPLLNHLHVLYYTRTEKLQRALPLVLKSCD